MRCAYLGNFQPGVQDPWSTESHVALSLESFGHEVIRLQEGEVRAVEVAGLVADADADLFIWTQTFGLAVTGGTREERAAMLDDLRAAGTPSLGFHLDRWFGLDREDQIPVEPFFRVDLLFTADGGHDAEFAEAGIRHVWSPPAVYHGEAEPGDYRDEFASDVAFVGSWRGGYHPESTHRAQLIRHLKRRWRGRVGFWPRQEAIRGQSLRDLYASVKVVVGDSCMVGDTHHYVSDRVPETLGRGGFLLHPHIDGIFPDLWEDGEHLRTFPAFDFDALDGLITYYLQHDEERREIADQGWRHTVEHHTYKNRLERLLEMVP